MGYFKLVCILWTSEQNVILCVSYQECVSLETKEEEKGMVPLTALSNDPLTNFEYLYYSGFTVRNKNHSSYFRQEGL